MNRLKRNIAHNKRLIKWLLAALALGAVYYVFTTVTHLGIPCVFHMITGLSCPGCGISRMFIRLSKLDFIGAFHANAAVFCLMPLWIVYGIIKIFFCPKWTENNSLPEKILIWSSLVLLIGFGILRNIPPLSSFL